MCHLLYKYIWSKLQIDKTDYKEMDSIMHLSTFSLTLNKERKLVQTRNLGPDGLGTGRRKYLSTSLTLNKERDWSKGEKYMKAFSLHTICIPYET